MYFQFSVQYGYSFRVKAIHDYIYKLLYDYIYVPNNIWAPYNGRTQDCV